MVRLPFDGWGLSSIGIFTWSLTTKKNKKKFKLFNFLVKIQLISIAIKNFIHKTTFY